MATILTALSALFLYFWPLDLSETTLSIVVGLVGGVYLLVTAFTNLLIINPLQQAEQQTTPRVIELFKTDVYVRSLGIFLVIFPIVSVLFTVHAVPESWLSTNLLFSIWLVLFGLALDLLRLYRGRLMEFLNPQKVIAMAVQNGRADIAQGRDAELCRWIANLSEIGLRAAKQGGISLAEQAVDGQSQLVRHFLTVHHRSLEIEQPEASIQQRADYVLGYSLDHLKASFLQALDQQLFPLCSHILSCLGHVSLAAAKGDTHKANQPLGQMGSLGLVALEQNVADLSVKASMVLMAVARRLVTEGPSDQLKEPLLTLVGQLELLAKTTFRKDKETEIKILTEPFLQLKVLFSQATYDNRNDVQSALRAVDSVLADFQNLELVMNTLPPIHSTEEDEEEEPISRVVDPESVAQSFTSSEEQDTSSD